MALTYVYAPDDVPLRLTTEPLDEEQFVDKRIEWAPGAVTSSAKWRRRQDDAECPSPETCVTLVDTFAPAAPEGLTIVASEGAMNLIWNPSPEGDLTRVVAGDASEAIWCRLPAPTRNDVQGHRACRRSRRVRRQAVDKAGTSAR